MSADYKKEWMEKSSIDYFSPFISLWLACNSWYQSHYSEMNGTDRDFIEKIKTDTSGRNHIYTKFSELIEDGGKDGISFRTDIELLHYALDRANLIPDRIASCSLRMAVIDYQDKDHPIDLIKNPRINQNGSVHANDENDVTKLDHIYITSNKQHCFAGLFEIIYQVRNMLVHGKLNPEKDEHEVVKYCYRILWASMN